MYPADAEWTRILGNVVIYEVTNADKLSYTCHRMCRKHKVIGRLLIFTIAGHLADVLPWWADPLSGRNPVYRSIAAACKRIPSWLIG